MQLDRHHGTPVILQKLEKCRYFSDLGKIRICVENTSGTVI